MEDLLSRVRRLPREITRGWSAILRERLDSSEPEFQGMLFPMGIR
jgi:hypothetical protein